MTTVITGSTEIYPNVVGDRTAVIPVAHCIQSY